MTAPADLTPLEERLRQHVSTLAGTHRLPGSTEHGQARKYIHDHLHRAGFVVDEVPFVHEGGLAGINVFTAPAPSQADGLLVICGAHYDSLPGTPGADDNASGVAALLELASWVQPYLRAGNALHHRLQLIAYDLEEWAYGGSLVHSRELHKARTPLRGMVSLEMLGYTDHRPGSQRLPPPLVGRYPDVGNFIGLCANEASRELLQVVSAGMQTVPGLPVESLAVPGKGEMLPEVRLSDHSPFWDLGYQALMITDTSFYRNPHYHQASDTPQTLDYPFLARVTAGVCQAVLGLLR